MIIFLRLYLLCVFQVDRAIILTSVKILREEGAAWVYLLLETDKENKQNSIKKEHNQNKDDADKGRDSEVNNKGHNSLLFQTYFSFCPTMNILGRNVKWTTKKNATVLALQTNKQITMHIMNLSVLIEWRVSSKTRGT